MEHRSPIHNTTPAAPRDLLGHLLLLLTVAALALSPTQLTLPHLPLSAADLLLFLAVLVWGIRWLWLREALSLPPWVNWLVVLAGCCSVMGILADAPLTADAPAGIGALLAQIKPELKPFLLDIAHPVLYLLIGVTVFRATLTTPARVRGAVIALLAVSTLAVFFAVLQRGLLETHFQPDPGKRVVTLQSYLTIEQPASVGSTFGSWDDHGYHPSRTAYAGFLGLVLPFALALLVSERKKSGGKRWKITDLLLVGWLTLLFIGAAVSVLAGMMVPAILLGLLVTGFSLGRTPGYWTLAAVAAYVLVLLMVGGHNRHEVLYEPFQLRISASEASFRYADGTRHVKKFWAEQQAALNLIRTSPLFGIGAGRYQTKINQAYDRFGPVTNQRLEPNAQNGYLLTATNNGLFGLAALIALYCAYFGQAWRLRRTHYPSPWQAAVLGAMTTLLLMTLVSDPWVRGTSVVIAALLAIILNYTNGILKQSATEL